MYSANTFSQPVNSQVMFYQQKAERLYVSSQRNSFWQKIQRSMQPKVKTTVQVPQMNSGHRPVTTRKQVALSQIKGSFNPGRTHDFDADFRPTQTHTRDRWIRIATARQMGKRLPPVELVQYGDSYYVRDGHHRISVAKMLGDTDIMATVSQVA